MTKECPFVGTNDRIYLRDVLDHIVRMEEKLQVSRDMMNYVSSTCLARVSIDAAEASNGMNHTMKQFG
jgi:Mg2+ and Co2+ transporter CorA